MVTKEDLARVYREVLDAEDTRKKQRALMEAQIAQKRREDAQGLAERAFLNLPKLILDLPAVGQMHLVLLPGNHLESRWAARPLLELASEAGVTLHYIKGHGDTHASVVYLDPSLDDLSYLGAEVPWPDPI